MDFTDKREGDLDALIAAHRRYLDRVVRKVLLLGSKRDKQVSSTHLLIYLFKADGDRRLYSTMFGRHWTSA